MSDTYSADQFIGTDLYAGKDGVPAYVAADKKSTLIGTFSKGQMMGRVVSYLSAQGIYGTNDDSYFMVLGNDGKGHIVTFFIPLVAGYFDKSGSLGQGVKSDAEVTAAQDAALRDADPIGYYWNKYKYPVCAVIAVSLAVRIVSLFKS